MEIGCLEQDRKYRCLNCLLIFNAADVTVAEVEQPLTVGGKLSSKVKRAICPICKEVLDEGCRLDHECTCAKQVTEGLHSCPECGKPVCPCGSHDVVQISRVTGYMQEVGGWNSGKQQELKDRKRYGIGGAA